MTTNHHTDISTGAAANAATFNSPLGELDGVIGDIAASVCQGRLTLTTGTPVTTSNVTAAGTLYFTPYAGNQVGLYDGSAWELHEFTERSLSLSGFTADKNYDIFLYDNSGTLTLSATAWTNDTTRATALTTQDGIYVKSGATGYRYLGTIRITSAGSVCEDSNDYRGVWNYYNRARRYLQVSDTTGHTYTTASWRAWNNDTSTKVEFVVGVLEYPIQVVIATDINYDTGDNYPRVTAGLNRSNANDMPTFITVKNELEFCGMGMPGLLVPQLGYNYLIGVEYGGATSPDFDRYVMTAEIMG